MPRRTADTCEICGAEKKQTNHWYVALTTHNTYQLVTWDVASQAGRLDDNRAACICGQACAHRLLDQFLSGVTAAAARPAEEFPAPVAPECPDPNTPDPCRSEGTLTESDR